MRSRAMLAVLHPAIRDAILRLRLPLVGHLPFYTQMLAEPTLGYVCVSRSGSVLEANPRAHHLVACYRGKAGIQGCRTAVEDLATRAVEQARDGQPWQIKADGSPSILEVSTHQLDKVAYDLHEDVFLVEMKEVWPPRCPTDEERALQKLTRRQREILRHLARTGDSHKEIAARLGIEPATVQKHVENIHRRLDIHSRADVMTRFKNLQV
jgi:DNA-binding CsgD family transcriptional regulator